MRAEGMIKESDYVLSQYVHMRPRRSLALIGIVISALAIAVFIVWQSWIGGGLIALLCLQFFIYIPWRARRIYRQYKALSEPVSVEVRDVGLFFKSLNAEGLVPWSHISKWRKSKKLLLIYPAGNVFHMIPSHFFTTHEAFEEFACVLESHVGDAT